MPHHHPCYCTDITKNSSPISKTLLLLAMSFSLADTSREKGISMRIGGLPLQQLSNVITNFPGYIHTWE